MKEKEPDGYRIPLHNSLTEVILVAGVPRTFFYKNLLLGLSVAAIFKVYSFVIITFFLHVFMAYFTKKDAHFFSTLERHLESRKYYDV